MVINEINIVNFGNISNKKIEFTDGFNVLCGNNEAGKSTVLSFIRFVLYGFTGRKSELKKYEPLSGEKINGSICVTTDNTVYEISRNLNLTKAKQVSVVNKSTGEVMDKEFCANIGENIVNLTDASFVNTLFVGQSSSGIYADKSELLTRLSNLAESGDEDISYKETLAKIDDEILSLTSPRRKNAVIVKLENEINELNSKIFAAKKEKESIKIKEKEIEEIKNLLQSKEKEKSELEEQKEMSKILSLKKREKEENNNIIKLNSDIDNTTKLYENIKIDEKYANINEFEEAEFFKDADIDFIKMLKKLTSSSKTLFILSLVCGIISVVLSFVSLLFFPYLSFLALAFAASCAVLLICATKKLNKKKMLTLKKEEFFDAKINYLKKFDAKDKEDYINKKSQYEKSVKEKALLKEKLKLQKENLEFLQKMHEQTTKEVLTNCKNIDTIKIIDYEKLKDLSTINQKTAQCDFEIKQLTERRLKLEFEISSPNSEDVILLMQKLDDATEKLKEAKEELTIYETFKKYLSLSFDELKSNFAPALAKETSSIFNKLTKNNHNDVLLNDEFGAKIKIGSSYEDSIYLSGATIDQLYFSVRLGIINTIGQTKYPVILDDAFAFYDDERVKIVLDFLKEYSKDTQILLASCQMREADYLGKNANIINL